MLEFLEEHPVLFAILTFALGHLIQGAIKFVNKQTERANKRDSYYQMVNSIHKSVEKQSEYFEELLEQLSFENQGGWVLKQTPIYLLDESNKLPFYDYFDAYTKKLTFKRPLYRKAYWLSYTLIADIRKMDGRYESDLKDFLARYRDHQDKFNEHFKILHEMLFRMIIPNPQMTETYIKNVQRPLDDILAKWQKTPNALRYDITKNNLLQPLLDFINQYKPANETLFELSTLVLFSKDSVTEMEAAIRDYKLQFEHYMSRYKKYGSQLKALKPYLTYEVNVFGQPDFSGILLEVEYVND